MPRKKYLPSPEIIPLDQRCITCRNPLNRVGRYCSRCLRSQRLKLIFGSLAVVQIAVAGALTIGKPRMPDIVASDATHVIPVEVSAPGSGWTYYDVTDPLIDDITHHARLAAKATPQADSAANPAANGGVLEISSSRHYGTSLVLRFAAARTKCAPSACIVTATFDRDPPRHMPYRDVSEESGTVLMMAADQDFVDDLLSAHDLTLVANLGTGQNAVMNFDVSGFRMRLAALAARIRVAGALLGVVGPG